MNGIDLKLFRFDGDLTWMSFFMDAEDRFYARYGGRSDDHAESYLSKPSLVRVMQQVLLLHKTRQVLPRSKGIARVSFATPEAIPPMKKMLAPRKEKCIHCHDVKNAQLRHLQDQGSFQKALVFTYPDPQQIGIQSESFRQDVVARVTPGSSAAFADVRRGDRILKVAGQRVLTMADFSQVLERIPARTQLPMRLAREGKDIDVILQLSGDWKTQGNPWWRPSTEVAGPNAGFWAVELSGDQKRKAGLQPDGLALRVTFLFPKHPTPRSSGVRLGDVVIELDGKRDRKNTRQLHSHLQMNRDYGDRVPMTVLRKGVEKELVLRLRSKRPEQ
jgi:hypothetical protein